VSRYDMRREDRRAWPLWAHLLMLCLAILVPGIALVTLALWNLLSAERSGTVMRLQQAVEHISDSVDRELIGIARIGESLAASPLVQEANFSAFDLTARQFLGLQGWFVILSDPSGQELVNTTLPVGAALSTSDPQRIREVAETGQASISDLFYAQGKVALIGVSVPVISGGRTASVLTVAVPTEIFTPLLDQNVGDLSWVVTIADRQGRIIARSHQHAESVGKILPEAALEQIKWGSAVRKGIDEAGTEVVRIISRSAFAGWTVTASIEGAELAAISRQGWVTFALIAAALSCLSIALAYYFARRISEPIQLLASVPLREHSERFPETGLAEANQVGAALVKSLKEIEASKERYRTLVEAAHDIIYTTDLEGRFLSCNAAGLEALGYSSEELLGQPIASLVAGAYQEKLDELTPTRDGDARSHIEIGVIARSGEERIWDVSSRLLHDGEGRPERILSIARDVTERRRAEEALRANEERLRLALAGIGAGVWEYYFDTDARTWSPEMYELYGLKEEDGPPGREEILELIHPDDRERIRAGAEELIKKGGPFSAEFRVCRPDGQVVWINSRGVIEMGPDDRPLKARGIDQNVTATRLARQHREELLRTTAQQLNELRSLYNSAPIGLALVDREFRFQRINMVLADYNGFPVQAHLGKPVWEFVPDLRAKAEPLFREVLETGEPRAAVEISGETKAQPGVQRIWMMQLYPLKSADGSGTGIGIICEDVTERKTAEIEQAHLAAIVDSSMDAIVSWTPDGKIRSWNPGAERMFGYTAEEAIGQQVGFLVPPDLGETAGGFFERAKAGERISMETVRRRKDGTLIPVSVSASPMRDAEGHIVAVSVIFRDISEQKRREEHTRFIMRELSHRSKNLLAVIQAMARQTARTSRDLADFQDRFTARVRGLAQSHDLLVKRDWRGVPVAELVRSHLEPFIDRTEHDLTLSGPGLLLNPEAAQNVGLALHELATNASKHGALSNPRGRVDIRWSLDQRQDGPRFRIVWRESGGPEVHEPVRRGFGDTVIRAMVARALDGETKVEWKPEGLVWTLEAPTSCLAPGSSLSAGIGEGMADNLQAIYRWWLVHRGKAGMLPPPEIVDLDTMPKVDRTVLMSLKNGTSTQSWVLNTDREPLQLQGSDEGELLTRSENELMLRCVDGCVEYARKAHMPCCGWARVNLDGRPVEFERLVLPLSEDGERVTHLLNAVVIDKAA